MTIDYSKITVVKNGEFIYNGESWTMAPYKKNCGFSPKGLWNIMTNGKVNITVYKADILKVDRQKAIALFN